MRSPDRRPRAVHLVLRPRPVPRHRALSRAPRDVQATVSPSTVPLASGGSRARRTRRDRTTEKRRVRSVGAERCPRHATGRHDVRGDGVRAGQRRSARVGGGCGKRVGGADVVREAPTRASARGHTVTIVQETVERRLEPRRGRGDERGEIRDGGGTRRRAAGTRRRRRRGRRDGDGGDDSDSSPGSVVFRQDSLRSWTSDRSGSSEASGSGTRRESD